MRFCQAFMTELWNNIGVDTDVPAGRAAAREKSARTDAKRKTFAIFAGRLRSQKIYYQMEKGLLHIRCEITLGKYQDQLLRLEDKLESGLYCELTDKTLHDGYIEYTLLYDMIANRITIDEVRAENGCLKLMKNLVWEYDALPHALIAGGTGGGKTYFLLTLIEALLMSLPENSEKSIPHPHSFLL